MTLEAGAYAVEWYSLSGREAEGAGNVTAERAGGEKGITFTAPFAAPGPAVLYLNKAEAARGPDLQ